LTSNDRSAPHRQRPRPAQTHTTTRDTNDNPPRRINISLPIPRITGLTAVSSGALLIEIARGDIPPAYIWPSIALAALGAAYDLARRALDQHQHP